VRSSGSLPLSRVAEAEFSKGELMRYLAELAWAPQAMLHNPKLSRSELNESTVEVTAQSAAGPARVRLIFENGDISWVEPTTGRARQDAALFRRAGSHAITAR
jgi:hypothetical protein